MKQRKLRNRILTFVLPLTLVPFTLMALAVYYFVIRSYQVQIEDELGKLLAEAIVNIRKEQEAARRDVALICSCHAVANTLKSTSDLALDHRPLRQVSVGSASRERSGRARQSKSVFRSEFLLPRTQPRRRARPRTDQVQQIAGRKSAPRIKEEDFFRRTLISGQVQMPVGEVQADRFASVFAGRVRRTNFSGIVVLHLNTAVFQRLLRPLLGSHHLSTFLFDDRGLVFEKALGGPDEEESLLRLDPSAEARALLSANGTPGTKREISVSRGRYLFSVLPAEEFISFAEPVSGESWFLGVLQPKEPILGQAGTFQAIFFAVLLLTLVMALWAITRYARRITVPLEQVAKSTAKIAHGQFDINLAVTTGDEVEALAEAVKRMAGDLKNHQAELIKSTRLAAVGEMASEISHEIQNRISGLSLWIQYLDAEIEAHDPRREYLSEMKQGLKSFIVLLDELKQSYRIPVLHLSDVSLNALVQESLQFVAQRIEEWQIELDLQLDPQLPVLRCDADKIKSVIVNLLINATDEVGERGRIAVQTRRCKYSPSDCTYRSFNRGRGAASSDILCQR